MENTVTQLIPPAMLEELIDTCKDQSPPTRKIFAVYSMPTLLINEDDYVSLVLED